MDYIKKFDNVTSFQRYVERGTPNKLFALPADQSSQEKDFGFNGTKSWEDAQTLLRGGDKESLELLQKSLGKVNMKGSGTYTRRRLKTSVVGFVPHISNYLQGKPDCMINITQEKITSPKVINILYNPTVSYGVSKDFIADGGAKILSFLRKLESQGYRVNLFVVCASQKNRERCAILVKIKSSDQHLDLIKVAYPLVNPSMLRRHFLRYIEVSDVTDYNWVHSYGVPIKEKSTILQLFPTLRVDYYYTCDDANDLVL